MLYFFIDDHCIEADSTAAISRELPSEEVVNVEDSTVSDSKEEQTNEPGFDMNLEMYLEGSYTNPSGEEREFPSAEEKEPSASSKSFFVLSKGTLDVFTISSKYIALPRDSELVSALWLVRVSGGAKVTACISHCLKLTEKNVSRIGMVYANVDGSTPLKLVYNEKASFSCKSEHGSITLLVTPSNEVADYIVGVVKRASPPPSTGLMSLFSSSKLVCRYYYLVYFELRRQEREVKCDHWRIHILSFKYIQGFSVRTFPSVIR